MHRWVLAILLVLAAVPAVAQDAPPTTPRIDLHLGLGYTRWVREDTEFDDGSAGLVTKWGVNLSRRFGVVFDGSFGVSNGGHALYSIMAGPRIAFVDHSRMVPFGYVVAGVNHWWEVTRAGPLAYEARTAAAVAAGGGLDVVVNGRWAVRVLQLEARRVLASGNPSELLISTGVVLRFGAVPQLK
jgi:hypothetical protein